MKKNFQRAYFIFRRETHSLKNDRIVLGRFLDKEYAKAMEIEPGEAQYRLENDPVEFRYHWMKIISKLIVIPVTLTYLLIHALGISPLFTLLTFVISLLKLIVPIIVKNLEAKFDSQMSM